MMKFYTVDEVLRDIEAFENVSVPLVKGLENIHFHQLYSTIVGNCTYVDVRQKIKSFLSFIENMIPNVNIMPGDISKHHLYLYSAHRVPANVQELSELRPRWVADSDSIDFIEMTINKKDYAFYILVDTKQQATCYRKTTFAILLNGV